MPPKGPVGSSPVATPIHTPATETVAPPKTEAPPKEAPPPKSADDAKSAARSKEGMVKHGAENKSQQSTHAKIAQQNLAKQLPAKDDSLSNPKFDKEFYNKLGDMPDQDLKKWFNENPQHHKNLRENYSKLGQQKMDSKTEQKMEKLGDRFQKLHDERWSEGVSKQYESKSKDQISKEIVDRVQDAEKRGGADGRRDEIKTITSEMRLLAGKSGKNVYDNAMGGFQKAIQHKEQYSYRNEFKQTIPLSEVVDGVEKLSGPGSTDVKTDMIKAMMNKPSPKQAEALSFELKGVPKEMVKVLVDNSLDKEKADDVMKKLEKFEKFPGQAKAVMEKAKSLTSKIENQTYPGAYVERLMKTDPSGIASEMQGRSRIPGNERLLDRSLNSIYHAYRKDPQKAADVVGSMLGDTAKEFSTAARQRPLDTDKIEKLGQSTGYLLESAKGMVKTMAEDKNKLIDEGAFIAGIFTKAVSKLTKFPGIEEVSKEVIGGQQGKEEKAVKEWQQDVETKYTKLLNGIFESGRPSSAGGSAEMEAFEADRRRYHEAIRHGKADYLENKQ
ncbi:hypothetical protein L0222_08910 [bacterium]|nr:hypothetical protein [bacterium]MCI0603162.1 hypothetical protein [bacterium]